MDFTDLQPAPENMPGDGVPDEAPAAADMLHPAKQSEEQEQIVRLYSLVAQMALGRAGLSEQRPLSSCTAPSAPVQVRVEMGVVSEPPGVAGEIGDGLTDVDALLLDIPVDDAGIPVWNWKGQHRTVGKNRTGTPSAA